MKYQEALISKKQNKENTYYASEIISESDYSELKQEIMNKLRFIFNSNIVETNSKFGKIQGTISEIDELVFFVKVYELDNLFYKLSSTYSPNVVFITGIIPISENSIDQISGDKTFTYTKENYEFMDVELKIGLEKIVND